MSFAGAYPFEMSTSFRSSANPKLNKTNLNVTANPRIDEIDPDESSVEETVRCPYIPDHVMHAGSLATHLIRCKATNKHEFMICMYNSLHVIPVDQYDIHLKECKYKSKVMQQINMNASIGTLIEDAAPEPIYQEEEDEEEEDWEDAANKRQNKNNNSYFATEQYSRSSSSHSRDQQEVSFSSISESEHENCKNFYDYYHQNDSVNDEQNQPNYYQKSNYQGPFGKK